ncbi:MAG: Holliday junction resolvase RuvX [Acidobacteria bacterium]|nr:MAG: Holliday junction resolvase RuvX [Acidobacteriota bacterium]
MRKLLADEILHFLFTFRLRVTRSCPSLSPAPPTNTWSTAFRRGRYPQVILERMNQEGTELQKEAPPAEARAAGSVLSIDYGRGRMGLAIADGNARIAQPLSTIERINRNEDMRRLRELVRVYGVKQIVMGLPLKLDGTRSEMAEEAERFARRVRKQIGVPVEMVDERLTSWEAERLLEETQGRFLHAEKLGGSRKRKRTPERSTVDAIAAAVILDEYLERQGQAARPR